MTVRSHLRRLTDRAPAIAVLILLSCCVLGGCQWMQEQVAGENFQSWNSSLGGGIRNESSQAQHSGYFFDRKAQQIEKNLGGGF